MLSKILIYFSIIGIDLKKFIRTLFGIPGYIVDIIKLKKQLYIIGKDYWRKIILYPIVDEKYANSGTAKGHYFHQDLIVAQKIFTAQPENHLDVGSRVDGFVAHVASFREITVMDVRIPPSNSKNIKFIQQDLMADLPLDLHDYYYSLSCLHALEHFGLGRYGDIIDAEGYRKGFDNLTKILKNRGALYLSVPIGKQRIEFNAHRVFSMDHLIELFNNKYDIKTFSYVDDTGDLHEDITLTEDMLSTNYNCKYGCGIFELIKV